MSGLVEEIQRGVLDPTVSVTSLLRKAKVAASKLNLGKIEDWVERELQGYGEADVPDYRRLRGQPRAFNPYHGWIPIILNSNELNDALADVKIKQSLASIEDLVAKSGSSFVEMPLPANLIRDINRGAEVELGRMSIHLSVTQLQGVIDAVRNAVLDWSLALEKAGIAGDGFTFDASEKSKAQSDSIIYNIGSIANFAGVMGSGNTTRDLHVTQTNVADLAKLSNQIRDALPELERAGVDCQELVKKLDALDVERTSAAPHRGRIVGILADLKQVLIGAAGNLSAEGAVSLIAVAMKALS